MKMIALERYFSKIVYFSFLFVLFYFFTKFSLHLGKCLSIFWSKLSHLALIPKSQQEVRGSQTLNMLLQRTATGLEVVEAAF